MSDSDKLIPAKAGPAEAGAPPGSFSLRAHPAFAAYLTGEAASLLGTSAHAVALPALAVIVLHANPGQVATLAVLSQAPAFVLALPAGAYVDQHGKRPVLIGTDLVAAAAVAAIPLAALGGWLSFAVLYAVALIVGSAAVLHLAAAIAVVPELVSAPLLHEANSRVGSAFSLADALGAYAGAGVVAALGAVRAFWLDALSYVFSAWCASRIRLVEHRARPAEERERLGPAIWKGLVFVARTPVVRPLVLSLSLTGVGATLIEVYRAYYLLTALDAGALGLGVVIGVSGIGGVIGALKAPGLVRRFGPGPVMLVAFGLYPVMGVPLLLAHSGSGWLGVLALTGTVQMAAATCAGTTQRSVRQQLTPPELQGRAQQTSTWLVSGARPFASAGAGVLAGSFSVPTAMWTGTAILCLPPLLLLVTHVGRLTAMPLAAVSPFQEAA
ncbi:MFS transporter [Streptomyces sp. NBC_01142]|uniref:MFS transporter n=1 Tax=Streptomyces sp. NBC_01142 TaxID=2975865 RepID=UPI002258359A|nr:MFS transporter [Streptomyces sp. NBC_01142]MCX4826500.1 MFS transporter [Streptomyces sp. NBC_01142]